MCQSTANNLNHDGESALYTEYTLYIPYISIFACISLVAHTRIHNNQSPLALQMYADTCRHLILSIACVASAEWTIHTVRSPFRGFFPHLAF